MLKYSKFLEERTFSLINESNVYYSGKFKKILKQMENPIAKDVLNFEGKDSTRDISFLNIDKEGYLSFITMSNAAKLIHSKYPHITDFGKSGDVQTADTIWDFYEDNDKNKIGVYDKSRNLIKLGKFINNIFPDKYTDKEIESFVNDFKSLQENVTEKILIVEGEDIDKWYDAKNYYRESGPLGNSCMRYIKGVFGIYNQNPGVCRLVILIEGNKLKGRALLWKLSKFGSSDDGPKYFMDRQYTIIDSDIIKFRNYAKENGWAYKSHNTHTNLSGVNYNGNDINIVMQVQVLSKDYRKYPYMDTFRLYNPYNGILENTSDRNDSDNMGSYILESTGGGYEEIEIEGEEETVWSDYYSEDIPLEESIYSSPLDDNIWEDRSVQVERGNMHNRGFYPDDYDELVRDTRNNEYYHRDDAVFSEYYDTFMLADESILVISRIDESGRCYTDDSYVENGGDDYIPYYKYKKMLWYKKICELDGDWEDYQGVLKNIMTLNYNNEWIPKRFEISVYPVINEDKYLTKVDAYALGKKLEDIKMSMDKFEYEDTQIIKDELVLKLKKIIDNAKSQLELDIDTDKKIKDLIKSRLYNIKSRYLELSDSNFV